MVLSSIASPGPHEKKRILPALIRASINKSKYAQNILNLETDARADLAIQRAGGGVIFLCFPNFEPKLSQDFVTALEKLPKLKNVEIVVSNKDNDFTNFTRLLWSESPKSMGTPQTDGRSLGVMSKVVLRAGQSILRYNKTTPTLETLECFMRS